MVIVLRVGEKGGVSLEREMLELEGVMARARPLPSLSAYMVGCGLAGAIWVLVSGVIVFGMVVVQYESGLSLYRTTYWT